MTITASLVEALLDLAKKERSARVIEVHLKLGKLRALSIDQVRFCYEVLAKKTILEGSTLVIEETNGKVRCPACGDAREFDPNNEGAYHFGIPQLVCPKCDGLLEIEGGDECVISKVRMRAPERAAQTIKT